MSFLAALVSIAATTVDELVVRWPRSGLTQTFTHIMANRIVEITEGSTVLVEKTYVAAAASPPHAGAAR